MNIGRTLTVLHVIAPNQPERVVAVTSTPFCIGRTSHNDLILADEAVARRHACLRLEGTQVLLVDVGSETGTWLGKTRLHTNEASILDYQEIFNIGPYQFWLEPVSGANSIGLGDDAVRARGAQPAIDPRLVESSPGGHVGVLLKTPQISTAPGSSTTASLIVINQNSLSDRFRIRLTGIPDLWVSTPMSLIELPPGARQEINLVIAPPRTAENLAGRYTLLIQVTSQTDLTETVEVRADLMVTSYLAFSSALQPPRIGADEVGRVVIRNDSNVQQRFTLAWRDPERLFEFRPTDAQMTLTAGQTAAAEFRAVPYRQRWFGSPEIKVYTVQVTGQDGQSQTHTGQLVTAGLLPMWMLPALALLLLGVLAIALLGAGLLMPPVSGTPTPTITPIGVDTDNDGVSDADEERLGSDPLSPDTDRDGLSDFEEVRRGTSLTLVDTDGDTLWDGQEVQTCNDPRNPDTDGDGSRDNVDPDPCRLPTGTPLATANPSVTIAPTYTPLPTYTIPPTWTPPPSPTWTPIPPPPTWTPLPTWTPIPSPTFTATPTPTATLPP